MWSQMGCKGEVTAYHSSDKIVCLQHDVHVPRPPKAQEAGVTLKL
nr:MAG TPA: hypothetical protein [Caudoviricetes sp.]